MRAKRFEVPESLLSALRARRDEQRRVRAERKARAKSEQRGTNFIDAVRRIFSDGAPAKDAAESYLLAMGTWQDEIEAQHDAFLLHPGMGPMLYLTSDGRILADGRGWDGDAIVELTGYEANAALIVGAKKTGIAELLALIPPAPPDAHVCPNCSGTRMAEPAKGFGTEFPCNRCEARGWIDAPTAVDES